METSFRQWLESQTLGGGLEPPKQSPVDPTPGKGQSKGAFPDFHDKYSEELPVTKSNNKGMRRNRYGRPENP